ncbi:unnamed protein product [Ixodes hexagonus]
MTSRAIESALKSFSENCKDLYFSGTVHEVDRVPSPLEFHRRWVCPNVPLIIRGGISHWPAVHKWTHQYLREKMGSQTVSVAVTPNGYADAVRDGMFVMPEERQMPFAEFLDILERRDDSRGVFYVQKQNSNFTGEFERLADDVDADVAWATAAFGRAPDAVNFWMGDARAVTSMHRDHYENIYCVVAGQKDFILLPPTDLPWVPYRNFRTATYRENRDTGQFDVVPTGSSNVSTVPWIPLDPLEPDLCQFPRYGRASPVCCSLRAGDVLYLPSLWFHHVRQSHACIALNAWYDMDFDLKYCYYKLLEALADHCV